MNKFLATIPALILSMSGLQPALAQKVTISFVESGMSTRAALVQKVVAQGRVIGCAARARSGSPLTVTMFNRNSVAISYRGAGAAGAPVVMIGSQRVAASPVNAAGGVSVVVSASDIGKIAGRGISVNNTQLNANQLIALYNVNSQCVARFVR